MLVFDPARRISVADALSHPWLAALHDESDEPVAEAPFAFDVPGQLSPEDAAALMWQEVVKFHPERAREAAAAAAAAASGKSGSGRGMGAGAVAGVAAALTGVAVG